MHLLKLGLGCSLRFRMQTLYEVSCRSGLISVSKEYKQTVESQIKPYNWYSRNQRFLKPGITKFPFCESKSLLSKPLIQRLLKLSKTPFHNGTPTWVWNRNSQGFPFGLQINDWGRVDNCYTYHPLKLIRILNIFKIE